MWRNIEWFQLLHRTRMKKKNKSATATTAMTPGTMSASTAVTPAAMPAIRSVSRAMTSAIQETGPATSVMMPASAMSFTVPSVEGILDLFLV